MPEEEPDRFLIWELRVVGALPLPPWVTAALLSSVLYAFYLIARFSSGFSSLERDPEFGLVLSQSAQFALTLTLLIGFILGAFLHIALAGFRDLQALGLEDPSLDPRRDPQVMGAPRDVVQRSRLAGLAGLLLGSTVICLMIFGEAKAESEGFLEALLSAVTEFVALWTVVLGLVLFWILGRATYFTFEATRARQHADVAIDLLNLKPLYIFGRAALRVSLAWIIGISIATAMLALSPGPGAASLGASILVLPVLWLGVAALALLLPVRGFHDRIAERKNEELRHLDAAIRGDRSALKETQLAHQAEELRLADLLTYKAYVEGLREWPFDSSTLSRFGLYLLIPVFSWLGGAFVERLVSSVLD